MAPAGVRTACPTCLRDQADIPLPWCATPSWHTGPSSRECLLPPPSATLPASPMAPPDASRDYCGMEASARRVAARQRDSAVSYLRADNEVLRARLRRMEAILVAAGLNVPSDTEPPPAGERDTDEGPNLEGFRREMAVTDGGDALPAMWEAGGG